MFYILVVVAIIIAIKFVERYEKRTADEKEARLEREWHAENL